MVMNIYDLDEVGEECNSNVCEDVDDLGSKDGCNNTCGNYDNAENSLDDLLQRIGQDRTV